MSGYTYNEQQPIQKCPYCGHPCEADFVDIGVGYTQCGPYHCESCGASEIGPYDKARDLTEQENKSGWYAPDSEPGSSANVIGGKIVSHRAMKEVYREKFVNNPDYDKPGHVENWFENIRKP